jgi:hypothetical protein
MFLKTRVVASETTRNSKKREISFAKTQVAARLSIAQADPRGQKRCFSQFLTPLDSADSVFITILPERGLQDPSK